MKKFINNLIAFFKPTLSLEEILENIGVLTGKIIYVTHNSLITSLYKKEIKKINHLSGGEGEVLPQILAGLDHLVRAITVDQERLINDRIYSLRWSIARLSYEEYGEYLDYLEAARSMMAEAAMERVQSEIFGEDNAEELIDYDAMEKDKLLSIYNEDTQQHESVLPIIPWGGSADGEN